MNLTLQKVLLTVVAACVALSGCESLSPSEEQQYTNLIAQGGEPVVKKKPGVAAALNVLPGGGDIYNRKWGAFTADLLLWWASVVWAVPQGYVTAQQINKKATIVYYTSGPGRGELDPNVNP